MTSLRRVVSRALGSKLGRDARTLYAGHIIGLLAPIVSLPYVARVLRPEGWGLLVFVQSFGIWLSLVLEFGFEWSGTRAVARVRGDGKRLAEVVLGVQSAKIIVFFLVFPFVVALCLAVPLLRENPAYVLWALLFAGARGMSPNWYFLGLERMELPAYTKASGRVVAAAGVFVVVTAPEHGWRVLALQALAMGAANAYMTGRMYTDVGWSRPRIVAGFRTLRESGGIFLIRGSTGLYTEANAFILGLLVAPPMVAFFAGAEKIVRAGISFLEPLSQTFFPRLSHSVVANPQEAQRLFRFSLLGIVGFGLPMGATAFLFAPVLVTLFLGPGYESAVPILRALSILCPVIGVSTVFGFQWALPLGLESRFYALVLLAGVVNLVVALGLVPHLGGMGMAVSVVTAEALVAGGVVVLFLRRRATGGLFK